MTSPATPPAVATTALHIDQVMPTFDVNLVQHIVVDADPASTYHALRNANLLGACMSVRLVRARDLPNRQRTRRNGHTQPGPGHIPPRSASPK